MFLISVHLVSSIFRYLRLTFELPWSENHDILMLTSSADNVIPAGTEQASHNFIRFAVDLWALSFPPVVVIPSRAKMDEVP